MIADYRKLAPYFRNGLLYVPEQTVEALMNVGLDSNTAERALQGLALDEADTLHQISQAIDELLNLVEVESPMFEALTSDESYFILTGVPLKA